MKHRRIVVKWNETESMEEERGNVESIFPKPKLDGQIRMTGTETCNERLPITVPTGHWYFALRHWLSCLLLLLNSALSIHVSLLYATDHWRFSH